ncbi:hypothetical protein SprV_0200717700 [Sparganum proliferum]
MMQEFTEARIQYSDMPEEMQYYAVDCAAIVLSNEKSLKKAADYVKKEFDKFYEPGWNCIIGDNFGRKGIDSLGVSQATKPSWRNTRPGYFSFSNDLCLNICCRLPGLPS